MVEHWGEGSTKQFPEILKFYLGEGGSIRYPQERGRGLYGAENPFPPPQKVETFGAIWSFTEIFGNIFVPYFSAVYITHLVCFSHLSENKS